MTLLLFAAAGYFAALLILLALAGISRQSDHPPQE